MFIEIADVAVLGCSLRPFPELLDVEVLLACRSRNDLLGRESGRLRGRVLQAVVPSVSRGRSSPRLQAPTSTARRPARSEQPRLDRLFEYAREHANASGLLNHQNPLLSALFSIDLDQESHIGDHEQRLEEDVDPTPASKLSTLRLSVPVIETSNDVYGELSVAGDIVTGLPTDLLTAV